MSGNSHPNSKARIERAEDLYNEALMSLEILYLRALEIGGAREALAAVAHDISHLAAVWSASRKPS